MMAKIIQLLLFDDLPPEQPRRTRDGTRERKTGRYVRANAAYDRLQYIMARWRKKRLDLPPRYQFLTGCADLREFLRVHQRDFWSIARRLGRRSISAVRKSYGRAGWHAWSWDHLTLHEHATGTEAGLAAATNARNLRPMIAGENVRRKDTAEDPSQFFFVWK